MVFKYKLILFSEKSANLALFCSVSAKISVFLTFLSATFWFRKIKTITYYSNYGIAFSSFDNNYLISREHSLVRFSAYINVRTCETCCCVLCDTCQTLRSHWRKVPCHLTLPMFHIQGVSQIKECGEIL